MAYTIISPPFTLKFREMKKRELQDYAAWFHEELPGRLLELEGEVRRTAGMEGWQPDLGPESLNALGEWFAGQVQTRSRTEEETEAVLSSAPWIDVPGYELTNRTFSLAMDIGMYFGRAVLQARPDAHWDQPLKNKKFADHGQPVIAGLGVVPLNPVRIVVNLAYGLVKGEQKGSRLRELYDYWVGQGRS